MTSRAPLPNPELAQVLADPTRRRVLDLVVASHAPTTVAELTDAVGLNHNTVRQHLARLCSAGLVIESHEHRRTPGRPRLLYRAAHSTTTDGRAQYELVARLLLRALRTGAPAIEVGREAGREDAADAATPHDTDAITALEHETARLGFMPTRFVRREHVDLVLHHCPIADIAAQDPATICALHRGLAEGLVDALGGARVTGLTVRNPHSAGCRIRVEHLD
jgi:predicted ArsR family transcriptional regulator